MLRWTGNAVGQLKAATDYLEQFSEKSANELLNELIGFVDTLPAMPLRFPECPYLRTKDKIYRNALWDKYRIIYKVLPDEVIVLGIIHVSRNPGEIKKLRRVK